MCKMAVTCREDAHQLFHGVEGTGIQGEILEKGGNVPEIGSEGSVVEGEVPIPTGTTLIVVPEGGLSSL